MYFITLIKIIDAHLSMLYFISIIKNINSMGSFNNSALSLLESLLV